MIFGRKPIGTIAYMGGIPCNLEKFTWSWGQQIAYCYEYICQPNESIHLDKSRCSVHDWGRNGLVDSMLGDWLFMLDTDHEFEPDLLARLLHRMNQYDLDVVCGVYLFKEPPHAPVLYGWYTPSEEIPERLIPLAGWGDMGDVIQVGGAGGGCLLARKRVFDRIKTELNERPFSRIGEMGEDLSFFTRLKKIGVTPFVDTRIECHHLRVQPISLADFDDSKISFEKVQLPDAMLASEAN